METCPISGTIERGSDPLEDAEQVKKLLANRKEESELTMCTDVDRNDKSRICNPGTVKILGKRPSPLQLSLREVHLCDMPALALYTPNSSFDGPTNHSLKYRLVD